MRVQSAYRALYNAPHPAVEPTATKGSPSQEEPVVSKHEELPPMGLPIREQSSSKYMLGLVVATVITGALVLGLGYGMLQLTGGPCEEFYREGVDGLKAQVDYLKDNGTALGVNAVEIQELRASTQVAGDALRSCCEQRQEGAISEENYRQCGEQAKAMAALPDALVAARNEPDAAKDAIRSTATTLRNIAGDVADLALPAVASSDAGAASD